MSVLMTVLVVLLILYFVGGYAAPGFRTHQYYYPGLGTIVVILVILFVLGRL